MTDPTPEEIARVREYDERTSLKNIQEALVRNNVGGHCTYMGFPVDKSWPPEALVACCAELSKRLRKLNLIGGI